MTTQLPSQGIPEDRVASILARAVEIDRTTRETVTADALRAAAIDAGISVDAVDTALAEYAAGEVAPLMAPAAPSAGRGRRFARVRGLFARLAGPLKLAALGLGLGILAGIGEGAFVLGFGALIFVAGRLTVRFRPARRARGYMLRVVLMAVGLASGMGFALVDEEVILTLFPVTLALLIAGAAVIKVRFRSGELEAPAS